MNEITKQTIELINSIQKNEECNIEISKDNKFIIRLNKDNKLRYIGSKYSVQKDIDSFANAINCSNLETIFIVFGLGAGEHIKYLYNKISDSNKIIIVEPSAAIIKEIMKISEYSDILQDDNIALYYLDNKLKKNLDNFIEDHMINNIKFLTFANYNLIFADEYKFLLSEIENVRRNKRIGNNTLNRFSKLFFKNFIENMLHIDGSEVINSYKDVFTNKPAIIVSAGPSLEKNIHLLKDVQDKFIIICGARSLKPLINIGVRPDFICAVDPQKVTHTIMKENLNNDIPLVFMESSNHQLVKEYKGPKILFSNQGMEQYLKDLTNNDVDSLLQGGSVAHVCMGLAIYLGCKTVIFVGQDLAYTNDKYHAESAKVIKNPGDVKADFYEKNKEIWYNMKNEKIYIEDIFGNKVRTSLILNSYREEFEELISECPHITFINSTEGGANIKGTKVLSLKNSINEYGNEKIDKCLNNIIKDKKYMDGNLVKKSLNLVKHNLLKIIEACKTGIRYANDMHDYYAINKKVNINKVFNDLDKVDAVIGDIQKIGIIAYILFPYMEPVLNNEGFCEKPNETEREGGIRIAKRCTALYESIIKASNEALRYLSI